MMSNTPTEAFYARFKDVEPSLSKLMGEGAVLDQQREALESRVTHLEFIRRVLQGLQTTPQQRDPGKYGIAFYFVEEIKSEEIIRADAPSLHKPCPTCKTEYPVIMSYEQTYDSPEEDEWEKKAFIICGNCKQVHGIAHFCRDHRF